jgi:hypothetical protein
LQDEQQAVNECIEHRRRFSLMSPRGTRSSRYGFQNGGTINEAWNPFKLSSETPPA